VLLLRGRLLLFSLPALASALQAQTLAVTALPPALVAPHLLEQAAAAVP